MNGSDYQPTVSVITRTKERPIFLKRAISSVSNQEFQDFLHIIVNDGGDKKQVENIISEFSKDIQSKIRLFHRDISSNAPDTLFNESIDKIASKFFAIHDDDDTWHPGFLQLTVAHLEASRDNIAAVVVKTDKVLEVVSDQSIIVNKTSQWMPDLKAINLYRQCIDNQLTPISTLFRRSAYESIGKFNNNLPVVGDWEFGVRLLREYDVDYLDPGYALASYHHRDKVGSSQDSVSSHEKHRYYTNQIMNAYLREELTEGRLGVGYIMSKLRYDQHEKAEMVRRVLPRSIAERMQRWIQR